MDAWRQQAELGDMVISTTFPPSSVRAGWKKAKETGATDANAFLWDISPTPPLFAELVTEWRRRMTSLHDLDLARRTEVLDMLKTRFGRVIPEYPPQAVIDQWIQVLVKGESDEKDDAVSVVARAFAEST